jgi:hypothetical protein
MIEVLPMRWRVYPAIAACTRFGIYWVESPFANSGGGWSVTVRRLRQSRMYKTLVLLALLFIESCAGGSHPADRFSDEPEHTGAARLPFKAVDSYDQALLIWRTPEDISGWIADSFVYDSARVILLSETQRSKNKRVPIFTPSEFFERKTGVCVDLARFGLETLRSLDPGNYPKYLMIEFEAMHIQGNTLRMHWLVSFRRDGKVYFFADSKRPGHIAGPYADTQAFISEYEQYRGRRILAFRELETYEKQQRIQARPSP